MEITILTTISNPIERQDPYLEALASYLDFADEVIVVNGGNLIPLPRTNKITEVMLAWPKEWNWIELPKHLNEGLKHATKEWILKLDIDQILDERDFHKIKAQIEVGKAYSDVITMQKVSFSFNGKWWQKGEVPNIFRNLPTIRFGKDVNKKTDLCFPIHETGQELVYDENDKLLYELPIGRGIESWKSGISFWNYDYFFKTKEFTKKEFWRFSRAYHRYFNEWTFGANEEDSFRIFLQAQKNRYLNAPYNATISTHPKYIRDKVKALTSEQFGYDGWGMNVYE